MARGDLLRLPGGDGEPVATVASRDVVTVQPDEAVFAALHRLLEEGVEHLPVVESDGRLVGICTRTDVLRTRRNQLELERPQPGWRLPGRLRRRPETTGA